MKKILSILIAISLIISMLPIAFADGGTTEKKSDITIVYELDYDDIIPNSQTATLPEYNTFTYEATDGLWEYAANCTNGTESWETKGKTAPDASNIKYRTSGIQIRADKNNWFAIKINVPVSGVYAPIASWWAYKTTTKYISHMNYYLIPCGEGSVSEVLVDSNFTDDYLLGYACHTSPTTGSGQDIHKEEPIGVGKYLKAGNYYLVYKPYHTVSTTSESTTTGAVYAFAGTVVLDGGEGSVPVIKAYSADKSEIAVNEVTTVTATSEIMSNGSETNTSTSHAYYDFNAAENVTYTYSSEDSCVSVITNEDGTGTVTGLSAGMATITVKATKGEFSSSKSIKVNVTAPAAEPEVTPESAPTTVNYGVFVSDTACASAVTANGTKLSETTDNIATGTLTPGATLTATAEDNVTGFKFRYWVLGSAATGRYYSSENTVTVNPYANIALTAIYTEVEEETEYLDFFNWNGDYVDSKAIADGKVTALPTATLTGYEFAHWLLEDNVTKITTENYATTEIPDGVSKAMAQYTALNGYDSSNKPEGTSEHGWTRGGKLVSYSETYEFFKWLNEVGEIKAYDTAVEDKIPLVVLEENSGVYMIEYDEGEYDIVEAGILFGNNADVDVKGAYSKATVKRLLPHGQFTAAPISNATAGMQSNARGYVMYRDKEDNIKVVYSK